MMPEVTPDRPNVNALYFDMLAPSCTNLPYYSNLSLYRLLGVIRGMLSPHSGHLQDVIAGKISTVLGRHLD